MHHTCSIEGHSETSIHHSTIILIGLKGPLISSPLCQETHVGVLKKQIGVFFSLDLIAVSSRIEQTDHFLFGLEPNTEQILNCQKNEIPFNSANKNIIPHINGDNSSFYGQKYSLRIFSVWYTQGNFL